MAIPYPKREFLSDEDEEKADNKPNNHPENNHGPSAGKRVRLSGMTGPTQSNISANANHGLPNQQNLQYTNNGAQQNNPNNYGQRY